MGRRTITATLAVGLTAALISPPAQAVPGAAHIGVTAQAVPAAPMVLAAAKKKAKGTVQVELTGAGSYTVTGKGFRKTAQSSKSFKVAAGLYKVSAPGASVSPGSVKVKPGKKVRVTVAFPVAPVVTPPPVVSPPAQTPPPPAPTTPPPPPADTTPPGPVSGLTVGTRTASSIGLSWTNPGDADLAEIIVRRAQGGTAPATPTAGTAVSLGSLKASSVTDTGLSADSQYSFAVFTRDGTGNTNPSGVTVTASTMPTPDTTPPGQVSGLAVGTRTPSSIALSWTNPGDADLAEIVVRRALGGTPPATPSAGLAVTLPSLKATGVTDTGLAADTNYAYAVFTRDTIGNTTTTPVTVTARTQPTPDTTPPGPVTGLTVGTRTPSSIALSWTNPVDADLAEVVVRRAEGSTAPATPSAGQAVTLPSLKATGVTDTGLAADTDYAYSVFTGDTIGNTTTSPVTTVARTQPTPDTTPPPTPTGLTATPGHAQVEMHWNPVVAADLADYQVLKATSNSGPWTQVSGSPTTQTSLTVTGLSNGTTYWFAVTARDTTGNTSTPSSGVSSKPVADTTPPGPVANLAITARGDTFIHLSWTNPDDTDLAQVIVRRAQGATAPATPNDGQGVTLASPSATTVEDSGLTKTTRYSYAVFTRDSHGNTRNNPVTLTARTRDNNESVCAQPLTQDATWSPDYRDVYLVDCQYTVPEGAP